MLPTVTKRYRIPESGSLGARLLSAVPTLLLAVALLILWPSGLCAQAAGEPGGSQSKFVEDLISAVAGGVIGAVAGGLLGWKAAAAVARQADEMTEWHAQQRADLLYEMLRNEIDYNLAALKTDSETLKDNGTLSPCEWMARTPCPEWATVVWENSVPELARSVTRDDSLQVHALYCSIHSLSYERARLSRYVLEEKRPIVDVTEIYDHAHKLVEDYANLSNPLKAKPAVPPPKKSPGAWRSLLQALAATMNTSEP